MKVLIVEDNISLSKNISEYLKLKGIKSDISRDGVSGLDSIMNNHYDVIILDINLPGKSGLDICKEVRENGNNTPIIMLTSRSTTEDKILGLNIGADDYLGKPFDLEELVSRLEALYRRTATNKMNIVNIADLEIDFTKRSVKKGIESLELSTLEFDLLKYLLQNRGKPIDRKTLFENVWGDFEEHMLSRSVDVYISSLRKKIGNDLIETKKGFGYLIN
ncbi:MAG: response regulator transcription factor [Candidatus Gracilibacteria bacterium]|nr:response regulator transcription factor [Candidatus Gracilibacteria bacterium]